jgi:hypothetical protein
MVWDVFCPDGATGLSPGVVTLGHFDPRRLAV